MHRKHYPTFKKNNTRKLYKKRRTRSIYSKKTSVPKIVLFCVLVLALIFIVYSITGPIARFVKQSLTNNMTPSDIQIEEPADINTEPDVQVQEKIAPIASKTMQIQPSEVMPDNIDAFVQKAVADGNKAFMIELKTDDGLIWYNSSLEKPIAYNAVAPQVIDLKSVTDKFKENGLELVVKLNTFMDSIAPSLERNNTFKYKGDGEYKWLDNSADNGGKSWLNPYKSEAVEYNLDIVSEVINSGVKHIIIDSVIFPKANSYNQIDFEGLDTVDFYQARDNYLTQVSQIANQSAVNVYYAFDVSALCGVYSQAYGIEILPTENIMAAPIFDLSNIPQNAIIDTDGGNAISTSDLQGLVDNVGQFLTDNDVQGYIPIISDNAIIEQLDSRGIAYVSLLTQ